MIRWTLDATKPEVCLRLLEESSPQKGQIKTRDRTDRVTATTAAVFIGPIFQAVNSEDCNSNFCAQCADHRLFCGLDGDIWIQGNNGIAVIFLEHTSREAL